MDRAREWGVRVVHEASLHDESSFVTLTYSEEQLPNDGSLSVRTLQLFLKRLRKAVEPARVRFFACGEYGEKNDRPHYHVILFGYGFPDKKPWSRSPSGAVLYRSAFLESLWTFGYSDIGTVTRESGAYVAKYCLKKVTGPPAIDYYRRVHPVTGEVYDVRPEFATMSNRPGIGLGWFKQFESDFNPSGFIVVDGVKYPVPRYYRKKLRGRFENPGSKDDPVFPRDDEYLLRQKAKDYIRTRPADTTKERLAVREEVAARKAAFWKSSQGDKS